MKENRVKPWLVLVMCCGLAASAMGVLGNSVGVFYTPVATSLGVMRGSFTLHMTISSLVSAFVALSVGKIVLKYNFKLVILLASLLTCGSVFMMGYCDQLWQFYVLGALRGVGLNFFSMITITMIINNWFVEKHGLATSLVFSFSGIAGAIGSPLITSAINSFGWQMTYHLYGLVSFILVLPAILFPFKLNPKDENLLPYGGKEIKAETAMKEETLKEKKKFNFLSPAFILYLMVVLCICALTSVPQHLPGYAESIGLASVSALILSATMLGNISGKFIFGILSDKIGSFYTSVTMCAVNLLGIIIMLLFHSTVTILIGAFMFGAAYSMGSVGLAILCKDFFGIENYATAYPKASFIMGISGAIFASVIGYIYDFTGSYVPALILMIIFHGVILVCMLKLSAMRKAKQIG